MLGGLVALALICAVANAAVPAPGDHVYSIPRPEGERSFRVHVPQKYDGRTAWPLLLAFHGLDDHCTAFNNKTGFVELSEAYNFLLVYPCSTSGALGTAWNAGTCCLQPTTVDDQAFARGIVAFMQTAFHIDTRRQWSAGFSNGGMMTETLGCNASDVFSAIGVVSGATEMEPGNDGGLAACDKAFQARRRLVNVLHVHGNLDFEVPWNGDSLLGFPDTPTDVQRWSARNACSSAPPVQTFSRGTFSNQVWQQCASAVHIELVKNELGGHKWVRSGDFDTSVYMLDYFFKSTRPDE